MKNTLLTLVALFVFGVVAFAGENSSSGADEKIRTSPRIIQPVENAETFSLDAGNLWSRDGKAARTEDGGRSRVANPGDVDWAVSTGKRIPVSVGDVFTVTGKAKLDGEGNFGPSVVLRDAQGEVLQWTYGSKTLRDSNGKTVELSTTFAIPRDVATIEPRLTGYGPATVEFSGFTLRQTARLDMPKTQKSLNPLENAVLRVEISSEDGSFSVTDKRTGKVWKGKPNTDGVFLGVLGVYQDDVPGLKRNGTILGVKAAFFSLSCLAVVECDIRISNPYMSDQTAELQVVLSVPDKTELPQGLLYPTSFEVQKGQRIILPMNEGIGVPVDDPATDFDWYYGYTYGGHGLCMPFWGVVDDETGAGYMGIVETPDDAGVQVRRDGEKLLTPQVCWEPQKKRFGYQRSARFVFFDKGGHVAVAKRYRDYAKEVGKLVTFREKIRRNPNLEKGLNILLGAANIWCWDGKKVEIVEELRRAGFEKILWSGGGSAGDLTAMNGIPNVLTSRYDIYQDIMDPAQRPNLNGWHGDWIAEAWPQDITWSDADGTWTRGWAVDAKDKTQPRIPCGVLCDTKAPDYARKRISEELKTKPYKARFIDTTTASPWRECWHPDHPATRTDSRIWRMKLLELIGAEFNLVCGCETGIDSAVPYCDFFEGMLSLGNFRVPESGRDMMRLWDEVPERVAKYQVGQAYRLPLWELVYHDCCVAMWYWGDYNNKLPSIWAKRDLFNALYGTPPMYMFNRKRWEENKNRFAESAKISMPAAQKTAFMEMTDHRLLTPDRNVQETVFRDGNRKVVVTVNFGDVDHTLADGSVLKAMSSRIVEYGASDKK